MSNMPTGSLSKSRSSRLDSVVTSDRGVARTVRRLTRRDLVLRVLLCLVAAGFLLLITRAWNPPFPYRTGFVPERDLNARIDFQVTDREGVEQPHEVGSVLAVAERPLDTGEMELLRAEHDAVIASSPVGRKLRTGLGVYGLLLAVCALIGLYVHFHPVTCSTDFWPSALLVLSGVATVVVCLSVARDGWRAETIPLILYGMTVAMMNGRQFACLLVGGLALVVIVLLGMNLAEFSILLASTAGPVLMLRRIRSRTQLITVGLLGGAIAAGAVLCAGSLTGQAYGVAHATHVESGTAFAEMFLVRLLSGALWYAVCVLLAGCLMTGLLPYLERWLGIQTDLSLLDLGDPAHPLLQELAQRAPGTYNHSINVGSMAQSAADAIGANGLLTRVGAYFHDIGKMMKPEYFIENVSGSGNQHDSLVPTMSTLVIIAHVKDGADLARRYRLPTAIIDFVEQHHGTTLVEYFYRRAEQQQDPSEGAIDESRFRYPGPKPKHRETAVLMLADAAESAARALVDPTPARLEGLVHELARKRLLDGQFDDCGLTLRDLRRVEDSLIKSLNAVYHGRVKYPDQQTA